MSLAFWDEQIDRLRTGLRGFIARGAELFSSLEIKFKLSINIAVIVVLVIFTYSMLILPGERRVLTKAAENTCAVLLKKLSQNVRAPMLESVLVPARLDEVTTEVLRTKNMNVDGLEYIFVKNRRDSLIAHSDLGEPKRGGILRPAEITELFKSEKMLFRENNQFYEYYYPILQLDRDQARKIPLGYAGVGFSKNFIDAPLNNAKKLIFSYAALVIIVSVWLIYFFARKMVNQIHELSRLAREVGGGNLEVRVEPRSKDELGQLVREFNNMVTHLREKVQMQKFVSKLTVEMIQGGRGAMESQEGDRRYTTIFFSDIRNFSTYAELSEPEQIIKLINIYFNVQTQIIEANGGVVDKFMGDQIMALFQGPKSVENAVRAAVEIQRAVRELNKQRDAAGELPLWVGIGINHGLAVMGKMGSKNRMDYTVIGDVVNIANRLCSLARAGQIVVEYSLTRRLNGHYAFTRLEPIYVRNRMKPVDICEIDYDREIIM
ncbi:MAG: HAMP domain-containing protein [candidate division KSB1 bacterium]|nr:HAMP domain-containing protein [candidate division KSB1 bacterium]MDZ7365638.1 HAMP domain-containing protein [candidate division KSB1 bacterium]MDZ7403286.1 HAMP domain-containing protein [candidate division KSB1 bacterium]